MNELSSANASEAFTPPKASSKEIPETRIDPVLVLFGMARTAAGALGVAAGLGMLKASSKENGRDSWTWTVGTGAASTAGPPEGAEGPPEARKTASKLSSVPERADVLADGAGGNPVVVSVEVPFGAEGAGV